LLCLLKQVAALAGLAAAAHYARRTFSSAVARCARTRARDATCTRPHSSLRSQQHIGSFATHAAN
jgi:hypothetical protein